MQAQTLAAHIAEKAQRKEKTWAMNEGLPSTKKQVGKLSENYETSYQEIIIA